MPDLTVVNTSPLFYLHRLDLLDILNKLYGVIRVPEAVRGRVVFLALSEFVARRKKETFARSMEQMASDPAMIAECAVINRDFSEMETDGLPDD